MGQTLVPSWALAWHVATISVGDNLEAADVEKTKAASRLTEWKGIEDIERAKEAAATAKNNSGSSTKSKSEGVRLLNLTARRHRDLHFNASKEKNSFEDAAALRAFMISHARYSMTLRAALAAAAAANKSYGSAGMTSDLAAGFDL